MSRAKELFSLLESLEFALTGEPDGSRLVVMGQSPANNYHWSRSVGPAVSAAQLREIVEAARQIIETECLMESEPEDLPDFQNKYCDPHPVRWEDSF